MANKMNQNLSEIIKYLQNKETDDTGAYRIWKAQVIYESDTLEKIELNNTEVRFQYSYEPAILIEELQFPYYSDFRPKFQIFKYDKKKRILNIYGSGNNGTTYHVAII